MIGTDLNAFFKKEFCIYMLILKNIDIKDESLINYMRNVLCHYIYNKNIFDTKYRTL